MALLVEGLGVGGETSIEEYVIVPAEEQGGDEHDANAERDQIKLYGPEAGRSWVAKPVTGQSMLGLASRQGSVANRGSLLMDPLVTLFGSVHENLQESGSTRSALFPNFGSMFSMAGPQAKHEADWDEESLHRDGEGGDGSDRSGNDSDGDENLHSPLISRQTTSVDKDLGKPPHGSVLGVRSSSILQGDGETADIGGGWQLAWKLSEKEGLDGKKEEGYKRIYLHQESVAVGSRRGSMLSIRGDIPEDGEYIQAAALVSQPALWSKALLDQHPVGPAMLHPSEAVTKGPSWRDLFEPGVKHALIVGIGIQILQQVINPLTFLENVPPRLPPLADFDTCVCFRAVCWHQRRPVLHAADPSTSWSWCSFS